jgi:hypothetical protein
MTKKALSATAQMYFNEEVENLKSLNNGTIENHFSLGETRHCFIKYAFNQPEAIEVLKEIDTFLGLKF